MKDELMDAIGNIDDELENEVNALRTAPKKHAPAWTRWVAAAAVLLLVSGVALSIFFTQKKPESETKQGVDETQQSTEETKKGSEEQARAKLRKIIASYPQAIAQELSPEEFLYSKVWSDWKQTLFPAVLESQKHQHSLKAYESNLLAELLPSEHENTVCSPLNTYLAFSMLAEVSGGNTNRQILDLLNAKNIDELRKNASTFWDANYIDTPALKSVLANSFWLNNKILYNEEVLNTLATEHRASSFIGTPGTEEMNRALIDWTNDQTRGLLSEYTKDMETDPAMVIELLSTIYFKAMWDEPFKEELTTEEAFHGTLGDTVVPMMHNNYIQSVYDSSSFTATGLLLQDGGSMHFILPKEDADVNQLLKNEEVMRYLRDAGTPDQYQNAILHLSLPKFQVSSKMNLLDSLPALGVTDALDPDLADFSPLTPITGEYPVYLSKAEHAAMLEIDEVGVTATAYTELGVKYGAMPPTNEINLTLDRPFLFFVTGLDGSILFAGVIRNIK